MNTKVLVKTMRTPTIPRPEELKAFIGDGVQITWDGDTITLNTIEGLHFCQQLQEAGEVFTHQRVKFS